MAIQGSIGAIVSGALLVGSVSAAEFIVRDGQPQAEIVIADPAPRVVRLAAEELQCFVEKVSGAKLPISTAPTAGTPVQLYVGRSAETDRLKITDDGLRHGAFRMVSGGNWMALVGRDRAFQPKPPFLRNNGDLPRLMAEWDKLTGETWGFPNTQVYKAENRRMGLWEQDERGSLNAVYAFLNDLGVRWYLPGELGEVVPRKASIELPKVDKTVTPDFALRWPYQYGRRFNHEQGTRDEILWQLRLGLDEAPDVIGLGDHAHGMIELLNRDEVKKAHPEYYALWGGKRMTDGEGKPCLSSEGLLQANVRYARAVFDILDESVVSVMPSDGYGALCQCDLCKGKDTPERGRDGVLSDYVWVYVNRVAQEVYKTHPNRKISCFAYGAYALPPVKIDKLSPNLLVGMCQARRDFYDPKKREYHEKLHRDWCAKLPEESRQTVLYEYFLHTSPHNPYTNLPVFFMRSTARDLRALKGYSLGEFIDFYRDPQGLRALAVDHLNLYVTSRFWWNAEQDLDALLEEYYTLFYGPARDEMKAFIEYGEQNWMRTAKEADKISVALDLLEKAQRKVDADSICGKRIALIADYVRPMKGLREQLLKGRKDVPVAPVNLRDDAKPKIDGRLDDPVWKNTWGRELAELQTGRTPANRTAVVAFWSGESLYLGITCFDRDTKTLNIATTRNEDGNIWHGDCVEVLLETQTHSYYQFTVNPAGAFADLDRKEGLNTLWASGAEVAAHVGDGLWIVEMRIPAAGDRQEELDPMQGVSGNKPTETFPWYFNVCRQRVRGKDAELSALSPTGADNFHDLMKFAKLYAR